MRCFQSIAKRGSLYEPNVTVYIDQHVRRNHEIPLTLSQLECFAVRHNLLQMQGGVFKQGPPHQGPCSLFHTMFMYHVHTQKCLATNFLFFSKLKK